MEPQNTMQDNTKIEGQDQPVKVGVVLVTHTEYGASLIKAAEFILGQDQDCGFVSVDGTLEVDTVVNALRQTVKERDLGAGILILTDMFGGTPTNISLSLLGQYNIEVLTGVNLPMLLKVLGSRTLPLRTLATEAKEAGGLGIVLAGELLRRKIDER